MQPCPTVLEQAARAVVRALAPEGGLQGDLELAATRGAAGFTEYYIEDAYTRVPADGPLLKARLRACAIEPDQRLRLTRHAGFTFADNEIRLRCVHLFKAQPFHMLIRAEGVLSYEDVRSESRTPLWGAVTFYRTAEQLDRAFDREGKQVADVLLKRIARQARDAGRWRSSVPAFLPRLPISRSVSRRQP